MPKIHLEKNQYSVGVDEPVTIRAKATGEPPLTVTWYIDGKFDSSYETDEPEHTIKQPVLKPSGGCQIKVENRLGEDTKDITVTVHGKYNTIIKGRPFDSL